MTSTGNQPAPNQSGPNGLLNPPLPPVQDRIAGPSSNVPPVPIPPVPAPPASYQPQSVNRQPYLTRDPFTADPPVDLGYNKLAVAGFILVLAAILLSRLVPTLSTISWLVGSVLCIIGLSQTKKTGQKGHGLALAGVIISVAIFVLGVIALMAGYAMLSSLS